MNTKFPPDPDICPRCKTRTGIAILRGYPAPEAERAADEGRIILGGCLIGPNSTDRQCTQCGGEWVEGGEVLDTPENDWGEDGWGHL